MRTVPLARLAGRLAAPLLICFALAATAAPAQALQGWQAPVGLGLSSSPSSVTMPAAGDAAIVGESADLVSKAAGSSWGAPAELAVGAEVVGRSQIVADAAGNLSTSWVTEESGCRFVVHAATEQAGGAWSPPTTIWEFVAEEGCPSVFVGVHETRIAANAAGALALAWSAVDIWTGMESVWAATKPAGGSWGVARELPPPTQFNIAREPQVAIDSAGNATVVMAAYNNLGPSLFATTSPAGGTWSPVEQVSTPCLEAQQPTIAVGGSGATYVAWSCRSEGSEPDEIPAIQAATKPPLGTWSAAEIISLRAAPFRPNRQPSAPSIAVDSAGDATVVWYYKDTRRVAAAYRPAGGSWREPRSLSAKGASAGRPALAIDASGDAVATWQSLAEGREVIQAAVRPRGSGWQPPTIVSAQTGDTDLSPPIVATDRTGGAVVAWRDLKSGQAQAAQYFGSPQPPDAPNLLATDPPSPANDNSPIISGTAPTESIVDLFTNSTCWGEPVATGSGAELNDPGLAVAVPDNTTTSFYATATEEGETSSCSGPLTYREQTSMIGMPEALTSMAALDPLGTPEEPLAGEGAWSTMRGAVGPGYVSTNGWASHEPFPVVEAAYWAPSVFFDTGTGTAVSARVIASPGVEKRYFSLWLEMPKPATNKTGYELRFSVIGHNAYNAELRSWTNGAPTTLTTVEDVVLPASSLAALVDQGTNLSIWVDAGAGYVELGSIADEQFSSGYAGIAASGNGTRLRRFAAGELPPIAP